MKTLACPNCGANINSISGNPIAVCDFCDSKIHLEIIAPSRLSKSDQARIDLAERIIARQEADMKMTKRGTQVYHSRRLFWRIVLAIWLVTFISLMTITEMVESSIINDMSYSSFFFGLIYVLTARPRLRRFTDFIYESTQDAFFNRDLNWRSLYLVWTILMIICTGIPSEHPLNSAATALGSLSLLAGCILIPIYRPSRIRDRKR